MAFGKSWGGSKSQPLTATPAENAQAARNFFPIAGKITITWTDHPTIQMVRECAFLTQTQDSNETDYDLR